MAANIGVGKRCTVEAGRIDIEVSIITVNVPDHLLQKAPYIVFGSRINFIAVFGKAVGAKTLLCFVGNISRSFFDQCFIVIVQCPAGIYKRFA